MTDKQNSKVLESAISCTFYDDIIFKNADFSTFKLMFFNAVAGRMEKGCTQQDVAKLLNIGKRTVIKLEKGNSNNLKLVLSYISLFQHDFATQRKKRSYKRNKILNKQ